MYRLVALDLDDTLLTTDKQISAQNRKALSECLNQGIRVVTASGRFNESQLVFIKEIGLNLESEYHIGDGGGTLFNEDEILKVMGVFEDHSYLEVLKQIETLKLSCFVSTSRYMYYTTEDQPLYALYNKPLGVRRPYLKKIKDLKKVENALKIVFAYTSQEELERIKSIQCKETLTFHAGGNLVEITMKNLNKFEALKVLGAMYGITAEEMVCIGDSENDIPMVQGAGLGLAMKNAMDTLKKKADIIGEKTNDEDGVAWLLNKYVLK